MKYQLGRTDAEKMFPEIHADGSAAMDALTERVKEHDEGGAEWRIKKASDEFGRPSELADAIARLDDRLAKNAENQTRDTFRLDSVRADVTYIIKELEPEPALRFFGRKEWDAAPPRSRSTMRSPAPNFYVHHTVTASSDDLEAQKRSVHGLQSAAFGDGHSDIDYSFVLFNDGAVFEGRGWGAVGGHTFDHNSDGYGAAAVGNFMTMKPSDELIGAYIALILQGKDNDQISETVHILGHRDVGAEGGSTQCPGDKLYARLRDIRRGVS
ncbi:MAG: N-acetylmuramoyl-L-alanine amidase [Actinomycetota bacterium]